jgi:uncharacterized protein YkwD
VVLGLACALASAAQATGNADRGSGGKRAPGGAQPSGGAPAGAEAPVVPAAAAATIYMAGPANRRGPPPDRLRDAILEDARAAARRAGRTPPVADARLDWAMTDLARHLGADELPEQEAVAFLLAHYGLVEPSPHFFFARASPGADEEIRARAGQELAAALHAGAVGRIGIGIDRAGAELHVVAGFQETPIVLEAPIPRRLRLGGRARVAARIDAAYRDPELAITAPDGRVHEEPPARGRNLDGELRCDADGRYQVEIVATGAVGPTVLANFPVYCEVAPPLVWTEGVGMRQGSADPARAEQEIVALVNRDRARAGLAPVTVDARLAAIARAHCQDMVDHDFVGHVSRRTGDAADRARRAGLSPALLFENIARAYSPAQAESGFLGSPGHRGNMLDPRARRIGVGVVFGPEVTGARPMLVTELLSS